MDLSKASNERKLQVCRKYFLGGFAFLPFLWAINAVWFYGEAFKRPTYPEQNAIKRYVIYSMVGALSGFFCLTLWIITFQINRAEWGEFADNLSFIIPFGRA